MPPAFLLPSQQTVPLNYSSPAKYNISMSALIALRSYLFRYRVAIIGGLLFLICANIVALVQPYLLRLAVDSLNGSADPGLLLRYGLAIVGLGVGQAILQFYGRYLQAKVSRQIEYELRGKLFQHFEK